MYASFFGLRELPFNNTPDPRFFFSTPDHEEALASLIYAIGEGKGFVLLTGEVGAGKTLVTRLMLRHFGESIEFASINNTQVTANELLQCVCSEFGIDFDNGSSNADLIHALQDFLLTSFASNKPVVLMLDEAQALSQQAFEQIRMIGNLEADDAKLLQIVIVGQPELQQRFEANDMRQLRQRIFRSFHLSALTREQTEGYIRHRLSVAGASYPTRILNSDAIDVIFEYSQGIPRLVNTVCDNALLSAVRCRPEIHRRSVRTTRHTTNDDRSSKAVLSSPRPRSQHAAEYSFPSTHRIRDFTRPTEGGSRTGQRTSLRLTKCAPSSPNSILRFTATHTSHHSPQRLSRTLIRRFAKPNSWTRNCDLSLSNCALRNRTFLHRWSNCSDWPCLSVGC